MKKLILLILVLGLAGFSLADEIHFKDGRVMVNVNLLESDDENIVVAAADLSLHTFEKAEIDKIVESKINYDETSKILEHGEAIASLTKKELTQPVVPDLNISQQSKYEYPHLKLISLSFVAFGISYDCFKRAGEIDDKIEILKEDQLDIAGEPNPNADYSTLRSEKSRKKFLGYSFLIAGVVNTYFALERVRVIAEPAKLGLSYQF
ncbi:MAG: hypothetical protein AB7W47_13525 [Calditrichaceae bacterium]